MLDVVPTHVAWAWGALSVLLPPTDETMIERANESERKRAKKKEDPRRKEKRELPFMTSVLEGGKEILERRIK